jgi:ribosome-binding factor A
LTTGLPVTPMDKASRSARLADQIRDLVAGWLHQDYPAILVSVLDVQLSTSGHKATIWLTAFDEPAQRAARDILRQSARYTAKLHRELNRQNVPEVTFRVEQ